MDFGDIFSPVAKVASIRLHLFAAVTFYFVVEHIYICKDNISSWGSGRKDLHE